MSCRFGTGDGLDLINEGYTSGDDAVELAAGVTPADVTVRWTLQGDMAVSLPDGSRLIVRGQATISSSYLGIEQLRFADGTVWNRTDLAARALKGSDGNDSIVGVSRRCHGWWHRQRPFSGFGCYGYFVQLRVLSSWETR